MEIYISYKISQEDFMIYKRKYHHNFRVAVDNEKHQDCIAGAISKSKSYFITCGSYIQFFKDENFRRDESIEKL